MKILITGSSGMLGIELCEVLGREHEVIGLDAAKPKEGFAAPEKFFEADITDEGALRSIFDKVSPDIIIHSAAWTDVDGCEVDPDKAYAVNSRGTFNVAKASGRKTPLILISTDFVFSGEKDVPYREDDVTGPLSMYGKSKLNAEDAVKEQKDNFIIVRTSWLYGRGGKNFVDTIISRGRELGRLQVVSDQVGSPTYTKDLAEAIRVIVEKGDLNVRDIFHVSNSGKCSWFDYASSVVEKLGESDDIKIESSTSEDLDRPASRPAFSVMDTSKFSEAMGMTMRPWEEALDDYIQTKKQKLEG